MHVDHIVVGSADLDVGIHWVGERLAVEPVFGGVHEGSGTRNALLGLGEQYLEVLALDPAQSPSSSPLGEQLMSLTEPMVLTLAVAKRNLAHPVAMSRARPDGVRLEWELEFTATPLFFIDWKKSPRPSGLPDGGRISSLAVTTPEPATLEGVAGITVRTGSWRVDVEIDGRRLA